MKYSLLDLARNRFAAGYALLLLLVSVGLFMLEADNTKALISLTQVVLALVPLLALVFTIIYFYNQYEFTVLLAVQPLRRQSITQAQFRAVSSALMVSFLFGVGLPVIAYAPRPIGWTLLLTGTALTLVFCALGMFIAVRQRDRAKAIGIGLATWVFLVLVHIDAHLKCLSNHNDWRGKHPACPSQPETASKDACRSSHRRWPGNGIRQGRNGGVSGPPRTWHTDGMANPIRSKTK